MENWSQQFKITYKKYCKLAAQNGEHKRDIHELGFAKFLGISQGKMTAWKKGQPPKAVDIKLLAEKLGFSYRWLITGEGNPYSEDAPETPHAEPNTALAVQPGLPMVGFASCGTHNSTDIIMPFSVTAAPPAIGPRAIVAVAQGESMVPAGILPGQMCYCDPDLTPGTGEAVYIAQHDGRGTIKVYMQHTEKTVILRGWLPQNASGQRKEFEMEVPQDMVQLIAPIVFIKRRV